MQTYQEFVNYGKKLINTYSDINIIRKGFALDKHFLRQDKKNWSNDFKKAFDKIKKENNNVQA